MKIGSKARKSATHTSFKVKQLLYFLVKYRIFLFVFSLLESEKLQCFQPKMALYKLQMCQTDSDVCH